MAKGAEHFTFFEKTATKRTSTTKGGTRAASFTRNKLIAWRSKMYKNFGQRDVQVKRDHLGDKSITCLLAC